MDPTALLQLVLVYKWWILGVVVFLLLRILFRGNAPIGEAMRGKPGEGVSPGDSWFIESSAGGDTPVHSCSFVEFDGHGDYIDFHQHTEAWKKVQELASAQPLLLVLYCHGWRNNSQSFDVVKFVDFLGRLAARKAVAGQKYRVHGVYLGWRGNLYHPYVDKNTQAFKDTMKRFGGPVVSAKWHRRFAWTADLQEILSYWSRRRAAEHKVSSVPMARTVYTCATLVKSIDKEKQRSIEQLNSSRVMVMGHSFGALMLERALNATCLDPLMSEWTWFTEPSEEKKGHAAKVDSLPLDFVFFVNSAAPSLYAKQMRDFLTGHQLALENSKVSSAFAPIFISLTSSADSATRYAHPAANLLCGFYKSLRRIYTQLIKIEGRSCSVWQSWFFRRTPGHQPLLVDHWLEEQQGIGTAPQTHEEILNENLDYETDNPLFFWAHTSDKGCPIKHWKITLQPAPSDRSWAARFGPLQPSRCSYWFIRCDKRIIRDHNDVWSDTTMEVYAALYRLVEWARYPGNAHSFQLLKNYWDSGAGKPTELRTQRKGA